MQALRASSAVTATAVLCVAAALIPYVAAHGDESPDMANGMGMDMKMSSHTGSSVVPPSISDDQIPTYFRHGQYTAWMLAHVGLMIAAWVVVMPAAIMLSIARSRWMIPSQIVFHVLNGFGVLAGFVYNHATPDLYVKNSHHPLGWVLAGLTIAWTAGSVVVAYSDYARHRQERLAMTTRNMERYQQLQQYNDLPHERWSRDSGQGSDRNSLSLLGHSRQNSSDSIYQKPEAPVPGFGDADEHAGHNGDDHSDAERRSFLGAGRVDRFLTQHVSRLSSPNLIKIVRGFQIVLEKFLLLLGFTAICTGFLVYGGFFRAHDIFSGLAHFIKGGIFFWYGLLTLGRWMGAFGEFGWAWNVRPNSAVVSRWKTRIPSAEFVESFVIWLYGTSNVFLEHLNPDDNGWSAQDIEHVSITLLFFGGGLLGMLIESTWVRELLNTNVVLYKAEMDRERHLAPDESADAADRFAEPSSYRIPLNPMPALTIMLLGMMMSGHHQDSMVSTMMHASWGGLFSAFAIARGVTYALMYLKPPTSHFASRPPSELISAFCLIAGGILFMVSAHDTVVGIENSGVDAMTIFTVTTGLAGVLMAWEIFVFALKGWALRKERAV